MVQVEPSAEGWHVRLGDETYVLKLKRGLGNQFVVEVAGKPLPVALFEASSQRVELVINGERLVFQRPTPLGQKQPGVRATAPKNVIIAPMPGKVIGALVKQGDSVRAGDPLVILESMKMQIAVRSDRDAEVSQILVEDGASVRRGQGLVRLSD